MEALQQALPEPDAGGCRCRALFLLLLHQVLQVQCAVLADDDARVDAVEGYFAQGQAERLQVALDIVKLQALPFEQVFFFHGVDGVKGANPGTSLEVPVGLPSLRAMSTFMLVSAVPPRMKTLMLEGK